MLTPDKIKNKTFSTTGKGSYRAQEVDSFLEEVSASYEQVFRENGEIIKKMSILANKVEEYKKEEDSLRSAILSAQKLADQITADAEAKAESLVSEAQAKADGIVAEAEAQAKKLESDAKLQADEKIYTANKEANEVIGGVNRKVTQEKLVLEMLQREVGAFKNKMMDMYKEHLSLLDRLPTLAAEKIEDEAPASEADAQTEAEEEVKSADEIIEALDDISEDSADEFVFETDEAQEAEEETEVTEEAEELNTYEPAATVAEAEADEGIDFASESADDESFEDISSDFGEEEGFSLSFDEDDLEDDDEPAVEDKASGYASADDESIAEDDEDEDGGFSFKGFFKKK